MSKLFSSLFLVSFLAYLVFSTFEEFIPGFVSNYMNPQFLLIPVVVFFLMLLIHERIYKVPQHAQTEVREVRTWVLIFFAALITLGILWVGAYELTYGWRALVAVYGAVVVTGILSVLLKE